MERAAKCAPPLEDAELKTIWRSAQGFYQRISQEDDYVPPEEWNPEKSGFRYAPDDRTDVGQARLLGRYFSHELHYSPATDFIRYDGACWQETKPGARAVAHALTDLQLEEAESAVADAMKRMAENGAQHLLMMFGYATDETAQLLPIPYVLACDALERLAGLKSPILLPDAKCQVTYDYDRERIDTFLISTQHSADADLKDVRAAVQRVMEQTA